MTSPHKSLMGIPPNSTGMIPGWTPIKSVQTFLIGCLSMSRCKKIGSQTVIFETSFCPKLHDR